MKNNDVKEERLMLLETWLKFEVIRTKKTLFAGNFNLNANPQTNLRKIVSKKYSFSKLELPVK